MAAFSCIFTSRSCHVHSKLPTCNVSLSTFSNSEQLRHIFDTVAQKAKAHQYQLMLCHPSDLFQIKTSYLHNGRDVHLILHVPMAPANSILCLFQLHLFPLPFTENSLFDAGSVQTNPRNFVWLRSTIHGDVGG
jgi:hypothetical protein